MKARQMMGVRTAMVELYGRKATGGFNLTEDEIRYITSECLSNSLAYFIMLLQDAKYVTDKEEISDSHFAKKLGIGVRAVQRIRLSLEKAKMIKVIHKGGLDIVLLGYEAVIIYEATGCDVIKTEAVKKISKELQIKTVEEFKNSLYMIEEMYRQDPEMFD